MLRATRVLAASSPAGVDRIREIRARPVHPPFLQITRARNLLWKMQSGRRNPRPISVPLTGGRIGGKVLLVVLSRGHEMTSGDRPATETTSAPLHGVRAEAPAHD